MSTSLGPKAPQATLNWYEGPGSRISWRLSVAHHLAGAPL